jgi:hypothetical protein
MMALASAALIGASLLLPRSADALESCATSRVDVTSWPIVRSPRVPGLSLRLPRSFARDPDPVPPGATSEVGGARWTDPSRGRLLISREVPAGLAPPGGGPDYTRCEERVGSAAAIIVSYARRGPAAPTAGAPFRVQARLRWADGEEVVVFGDAADPERFEELMAAVRTIRRVGA